MTITLFCLVKGNPAVNAFPVRIDRDSFVSDLKDVIKKKKTPEFDFPADSLKLWKVEISDDRNDILKNPPLREEDELYGIREIGDYWVDTPPKKHIHVIVSLPKTTATSNREQELLDRIASLEEAVKGKQPVYGKSIVPTKSIEVATNEAKSRFDFYSEDLIKVATNKYEPYSYFEAPEENSCKKSIDDKKIPVVNEEPYLLLHNLPDRNEEGLTDYKSFEEHISNNLANSNKTVILGTSGCGKTRLCFEALCNNYGLYLIACPYSTGSSDLEESAVWTTDKIKDKSPQDAEIIAEHAVMSCVVGRLLLLQHLFDIAKQHGTIMAPKSWLILQLSHIIIRNLCTIFRDVEEDLKLLCEVTMKEITNNLMTIFPIVYDEAQAHTTYLPETFPSTQHGRKRPFFSVVVRSLSTLSFSFMGAYVCITGSGLSLLRAKDEISTRAKEELHIPTFNNFGQIKTSDELYKLVTKIFPLDEKYARFAIKWLKGRYRWSWTWIHYLIKSKDFDPKEQLEVLVNRLTTDASSLPRKEYSLYTGFEDLQKHPPRRPPYVNNVCTLEVIKNAIIMYSMTGKAITFTSTTDMDIMNIGFSHIKNIQQFTSTIDEPLVIEAGFNYFKSNANDTLFRLMSSVKFNATMPGLIWEKCVVNYLQKNLFESKKLLSGIFDVKTKVKNKERTISYKYLPEDFDRPPQLLPYGSMGQTALECTSPDDYIEWLNAVAKWEETGKVSRKFCPICYPPNVAGPDISIAFHFPSEDDKHKNRKSYILNVQVRLRDKVSIEQSFRTVKPDLMFMDRHRNPNPHDAHNMLIEIYKKQGWFDRNMEMIIIYPCEVKRKRSIQKMNSNTNGASSRKRMIPRVIIDKENADILFPKDCQDWIIDFKKKNGEIWDDEELDDDEL